MEPSYSVQHCPQPAARHTLMCPQSAAGRSCKLLLNIKNSKAPAVSLISDTWSPYKGRAACWHTAGKPLTAFQKILPAGARKDLLGQVPIWARKLLSQDGMAMALLDNAGLNPHPPVLASALLCGVAFQLNHSILLEAFY